MKRPHLLAAAALLAAGCATTSPKAESKDPVPPPARPGLAAHAGPLAAGASRVNLKGCLAQATTEEEGAKFPARSGTRAAGEPQPAVTVAVSGLGVSVTHELEHACCLKGVVTTSTADRTITVAERLEGSPCRCRCSSAIETTVGLDPGDYTLVVTFDDGKGPVEIARRAFSIESLLGR